MEDTNDTKEIVFKCKSCGDTKPLNEMVVMRQYYPQISVCRSCARGRKDPEIPPQNSFAEI